MTYEFKYLMEVLSYTAIGRIVHTPEEPLNWDTLILLANYQGVLPMLAYAIKDFDNSVLPEKFKKQLYEQERSHVLSAQLRKENVLELLSKLGINGIETVVLKGFSISNCYYFPDLRISGDTDLYISRTNERSVLKYMSDMGFSVSKRQSMSHHAECYSSATGWLEIHTALFDKRTEEIWFGYIGNDNQIREPYIEMKENDSKFNVLGFTDNMIFITLHLIKHFIPDGVNLRQILDLSIFYFKNYNKIDLERYWGLMKQLRYDSLIATILSISIKNIKLPKEWESLIHVHSTTEMEEKLIKDIEVSCDQSSFEATERSRSGEKYSQIIGRKRFGKFRYFVYLLKRNILIFWKLLFPKVEKLRKKYTILTRHKSLTPLIWIYHVFIHAPIYLVTRKSSRNHAEDRVTCSSRLEMFNILGMLQ